MGHTAGYLALNGAIATGSEVAIIPEMDTEIDQLAELISQGFARARTRRSSSWPKIPARGAMGLAERVKKEFPQYDARVTILGHIQRGGSPSAQDRILASRMGAMAYSGDHGGAAQRDDRHPEQRTGLRALLACGASQQIDQSGLRESREDTFHVSSPQNPNEENDRMKRVIGIGNALTDMLVNLESDSVLRKYLLEKGSMSLVDSKLQTEISKSVAGLPYSLSLGGSAGNTIRAMARLGCGTGFIGKVGPDTTGDFFEQALANLGVKPFIFRGSERSGKCVALISPDGERTMITHLGAALELTAADVRADIFEGFDCVYIEGYLVQNHELIEHTARTAKERGLQVAIDLASFNIVKENLDFLRALVEKYVDIVFANEDEAIAFTGENEPINALQAISQLCELAIVKIGIRGALIKHRSEVVHVGIMAAARRVDTTGAGDFYAAGFLYGMCAGLSLRQCGTIGAITAGKVIEVVGTTFGEEAWEDIFRLVKKVRNERYLF